MRRRESPRRSDSDSREPLILLVDDFEDNRAMYAQFLTLSGFRGAEAANGQEALQKAADMLPDLVVMDLSLPVIDGWEATRRLKSDERTRGIPGATGSSRSRACLKTSSPRFVACWKAEDRGPSGREHSRCP